MDSVLAKQGEGGDLEVGAFMQVLEAQLENLPKGPKMLILDNVSDIFLGNENIRTEVNRFIKFILGNLKNKHDLTILVLAHPSRSGVADAISGSTAWQSAVRSRLALIADEDEIQAHRVLKVMKSNRGPQDKEIKLAWDNWRYIPRKDFDDVSVRIQLLKNMFYRLAGDEEWPLKLLVEMILDDEVSKDYFSGVKKDRSRMNRLKKDLESGEVEFGPEKYLYEERSSKTKHWCIRKFIGFQ